MYTHQSRPGKPVLTLCVALIVLLLSACGSGEAAVTASEEPETTAQTESVLEQAETEDTDATGSDVVLETAPDLALIYGGTALTISAQVTEWSYRTGSNTWTSWVADYLHPLQWEDALVPTLTPSDTTGGLPNFAYAPDALTITWWDLSDGTAMEAAEGYDYDTIAALASQEDLNGEGWFSIPTSNACRVVIQATWEQATGRDWYGEALYAFDLPDRS